MLEIKNTEEWSHLRKRFQEQLGELNYHERTKQFYKRWLYRLEKYLNDQKIAEYSSKSGNMFLKEKVENTSMAEKTIRLVHTMINRLNELINKSSFRNRRLPIHAEVPTEYTAQIQKYVKYLKEEKKKDSTIKVYLRNGTQFINSLCLDGVTDLADVDVAHIHKAFENSVSKSNFCTACKSIMKFAYIKGIHKVDLSLFVPVPRHKQCIPSIYSKDETDRMLSSVDKSTWIGKRDFAIITIALRLGMRSSDIVALKQENIDFTAKIITFTQHKTGEPHKLALLPDVEDAITSYLTVQNKPHSFIFQQSLAPHEQLVAGTVRSIVAKYLKKANVIINGRKQGAHALRMTLASELIAENVPYTIVQEILGHNNPNSTKRYVKFDVEKLRKCSLNVPPFSGNALEILHTKFGGEQ